MVYLDISKALDKVWHKGLLYKLEAIGVLDPFLRRFRSYPSCCYRWPKKEAKEEHALLVQRWNHVQ